MDRPDAAPMSYCEYKNIVRDVIATEKYCDYLDVKEGMPYAVMRHDVDYAPEKAYRMQEIENSLGFTSSYFFMTTSNIYNAFSKKNTDIIKEIHKNGHHIGLHYHPGSNTDTDLITEDIKKQTLMMSLMLDISVDRFSFHRPAKEVLRANIEIPSLINTYSSRFFTYAENTGKVPDNGVKYIADSMFQWKYGYPDSRTLTEHKQVQILIHPCVWSEEGNNLAGAFRSLIADKNAQLLDCLDSENARFKEIRDVL